jgi:hypothetical protein
MNDIIKHIAGTYKALRLLLFLVGFSMPLVLMIGGKTKADIPLATHSMSAYYHLSAAPSVAANGDYGYTNIPRISVPCATGLWERFLLLAPCSLPTKASGLWKTGC